MLNSGEILNNTYQIISKVGSGGTGDVYQAYHLRLQKYVVVKKIKDNFVGQVNVRAEVDILKRLKHTYLPQVYDFVQMGSTVYTVMDYIEGCDLDEYIKLGYLQDEETVIKWLRQLCEVLDYLHSQTPAIIHSDIKPGNIMITNDGNVCLIDFNISLDGDDSSQISGISLPFASPEQFEKAKLFMSRLDHRGIVLDGRSDMYSLAASFYQLMTLSRPANPDQASVPLSQWNLPYSEGLIYIIEKAMNYDMNYRYSSMAEMLKAVNNMYKHTRAYRTYLYGTVVSAILYMAAMGAGIWMLIHGLDLKNAENFDKDYKNMEVQYQNADYSQAMQTAVDILNNSDYNKKLTTSKKINVLHTLGECYFELEDYESALAYYTEVKDLISDIYSYADYYRDYLVALVRCGYVDDAEAEIEVIQNQGIEEQDIQIIQIEILIKKGKNEKAMKQIDQLIGEGLSLDDRQHLLVLGGECAEQIGDYEREISYYERAAADNESISILRKLGNAYMLIVNRERLSNSARTSYINKAATCYEKITQKSYSSFNDSLNLAICYRALEEYEQSIKVLKALEEGKEDYRIYMHLAFAYDKSDNVEQAQNYTKKALNLYKSTPEGSKESEGSDNIQSLYELQKKYK